MTTRHRALFEWLRACLPLTMVFTGALALRIALPYRAVFGQEFVGFIETDAWYHMRLVDATVRNFPHRLWFDPYLVYPGGEAVNAGPVLDWVIAANALLAGLGRPSDRLIDLVGAYTPAVIGALTSIAVYFLGRQLFSRRAGLWAAFIVAVLPGQILSRSLLGYADHHCVETFLSTCVFMLVALAINAGTASWRALIAGGAGVSLGLYLLTWAGGALVVAILGTWGVVELIVRRLTRRTPGEPTHVMVIAFGIAALMIAPWIRARPYFGYDMAALLGGILLVLPFWFFSRATTRRRRAWRIVAFCSAAAIAVAGMAFVDANDWIVGLRTEIGRFSPTGRPGYVAEAIPLMQSDAWYPVPLWNEFGPALFLALLALAGPFSAARSAAEGSSRDGGTNLRLLAVGTAFMLAATFGQVRFAYYLAVNIAVFSGVVCDRILTLLARTSARVLPPEGPVGRCTTSAGARKRVLLPTLAAVTLVVVLASPAVARYSRERLTTNALTADWYDALQWMRGNTPEPFGDEAAYYRTDLRAPDRDGLGAYGVMTSWMYGYWMTRVGHRVPNANPRQTNVVESASFLLSVDPERAGALLKAAGSRYVIVDTMLQSVITAADGTERLGALAGTALSIGRLPTSYCEAFQRSDDPRGRVKTYCFPEYYRTMAVRLYAFGGQAVIPRSVSAISIAPRQSGDRVRRVMEERRFADYDAAHRFVRSRPGGQWRIASADPLVTCVPLEPLTGYRRVFRSFGVQATASGEPGPSTVQIYEYRAR